MAYRRRTSRWRRRCRQPAPGPARTARGPRLDGALRWSPRRREARRRRPVRAARLDAPRVGPAGVGLGRRRFRPRFRKRFRAAVMAAMAGGPARDQALCAMAGGQMRVSSALNRLVCGRRYSGWDDPGRSDDCAREENYCLPVPWIDGANDRRQAFSSSPRRTGCCRRRL